MRYPTGVPSPYTTHVHPYPTRFHGGIWRRPAFGLPWVRQPFNVIRPSARMQFQPSPVTPPLINSAGQQVSGMGVWDTGTGVFRRPRLDGGGIFNNISGLGMSPDTQAFVGGAVLAGALVAYLIFRKKKMTPNRRRRRHKRNPANIVGAKNYLIGYYGAGHEAVPSSSYWGPNQQTLSAVYGITPDDYPKLEASVRRTSSRKARVAKGRTLKQSYKRWRKRRSRRR